MQGGASDGGLALTAYVVVALLENGVCFYMFKFYISFKGPNFIKHAEPIFSYFCLFRKCASLKKYIILVKNIYIIVSSEMVKLFGKAIWKPHDAMTLNIRKLG